MPPLVLMVSDRGKVAYRSQITPASKAFGGLKAERTRVREHFNCRNAAPGC
jgi:hypothetical protein